jgi:hypothetical protein
VMKRVVNVFQRAPVKGLLSTWFRQKATTRVMTFHIKAPVYPFQRHTGEQQQLKNGGPGRGATTQDVVGLQCVSERKVQKLE